MGLIVLPFKMSILRSWLYAPNFGNIELVKPLGIDGFMECILNKRNLEMELKPFDDVNFRFWKYGFCMC